MPKYAGRPLVAGNVIAVAWTIAVIANVLVWAHHIYLDYPSDRTRAPSTRSCSRLTFALVIPSALSLYSLGLTVLRSNFRWTGASTALFLGHGLVAARRAVGGRQRDDRRGVIVHNTMWMVGHFHHMALLNIGLVIFAAIYHFIPELSGKRLWSDDLAKWHIWLTFLAGTVNSAFWMIDGLRGSVRRFAQPFEEYALFDQLAVVMVAVLALAQVLFVINMVQTLRGAGGRTDLTEDAEPQAPRPARQGPSINVGLGLATGLIVVLVCGLIITMHASEPSASAAPAAPAAPGAAVFASAGCGGCHTLASAGATGAVGPNLDQLKPSKAAVTAIVTSGRGAMPAFGGQLSAQEIGQVADYVSSTAGP